MSCRGVPWRPPSEFLHLWTGAGSVTLSGIPLDPRESAICLGCHTTAAQAEDWEKDPTFHLEDGVQCEKCHGPGSEYANVRTMTDRAAAIDAILFSFILAGGFAVVRAVWSEGPGRILSIVFRSLGSFACPLWILPPTPDEKAFLRRPMPLGPWFALGTLLVLLNFDADTLLENLSLPGGF